MGAIVLVVVVLILLLVTISLGVRIVPQGYKHVVLRMGKYHTTLAPGLNFIIPYFDNIAYKVLTKDISLDIPGQEVITMDNAAITANAIAFINIIDPPKAVFGIDNYLTAIRNLVQTSLRSIIGEMSLDNALSSRDLIKNKLRESISDDVAAWGIVVKTVEIQDIKPSHTMQMAMEQQAAAERTRRAAIREAEGKLEASRRDAEAKMIMADATREAISRVTEAIGNNQLPATYLLGEQYVAAIRQVAVSNNAKTVLLPADLLGAIKGLFGK